MRQLHLRTGCMAVMALLACACAAPLPKAPTSAEFNTPELLDGRLLFGETVQPAEPHEHALVASAEMLAFAQQHTKGFHAKDRQLLALLRAMRDEGYLQLDYDHGATLPAATVFNEKAGNCLSYTMMFVALARSVGLPAKFQTVDVPPTWNADADLVYVDQHVNAVVQKVRLEARNNRDVVVDFNLADYQGNYPQRQITDSEVFARYYSNLAVQAMREQNPRQAFSYLKRAVLEDQRLAAAWTNLGALYSANGQLDAAEATYRHTLTLEPDNPSALNNLATYYRKQHQPQLAEHFERKTRHYRDKNPYYHYQSSLAALKSGRMESAKTHLARALRLNQQEHQFHFLKAHIAALDHDFEATLRSLTRARDLAASNSSKQRYTKKIERLKASQG